MYNQHLHTAEDGITFFLQVETVWTEDEGKDPLKNKIIFE